jgi:hypothetical protein
MHHAVNIVLATDTVDDFICQLLVLHTLSPERACEK